MPRYAAPSSRPRRASILEGAWWFAGWMLFYVAQTVLAASFMHVRPDALTPWLLLDAFSALTWTGLSIAISWWHARLRSRGGSFPALVAAHAPTLVIAAAIDILSTEWAANTVHHRALQLPSWLSVIRNVDFEIVSYLAVILVVEALFVRRLLSERRKQADRFEALLTRARLDYLEAQLQPHFLFNALGMIIELAFESPADASTALTHLSDVIRMAARNEAEVTLADELAGIEPYLKIQRIRFQDWLSITHDIDPRSLSCLVPRFALQPLIENAIRHGLRGRTGRGSIAITSVLVNDAVVLRVTDNGVGMAEHRRRPGRGIGVANVRSRLELLYGKAARLELFPNSGEGTTAELTVPTASRRDRPLLDLETSVTEPYTPGPLSLPRLLQLPIVAVPAVWLVVGALWTQQSVAFLTTQGLYNGAWIDVMESDMLAAALWALGTPLVLWACVRFPVQAGKGGRAISGYACFATITILGQLYISHLAVAQGTPLSSPVWLGTIVVYIAIFGILLLIGHRRVLLSWLAQREARASMLQDEFARTRQRADALQALPPVLLASLDAVAATARVSPSLTERQLVRLADYVRIALDCCDEEGMTAVRVDALARAAGALTACGALGDSAALYHVPRS